MDALLKGGTLNYFGKLLFIKNILNFTVYWRKLYTNIYIKKQQPSLSTFNDDKMRAAKKLLYTEDY